METLSAQQEQTITATANQLINDHSKISAATADYQNSVVSYSFAVGPDGAGMQGWITYTHSGEKIHFSLEGRPSTFFGLYAGGGGLPLIGALPAQQIAGKVGTFKAEGGLFGGSLYLWVDGQPVFTTPLPLAGAGSPHWGAEGKVRFSNIQ